MQMIGQRVVVKVEKKYNDTIELSNGNKLYLDVTYNPEQHVVICGEVVATPNTKWCKRTDGHYIRQELNIGDKIYFNYLTVGNENKINDEDNCYMLNLEMVFCYVRNGKITATSNHVLVQPKPKEKKIGSIYVPESGNDEINGILRYIGTPKKNFEKPDVVPGCLVAFEETYAFENEIEGEKYYVMQQDDLLGLIVEIGGTI